MTTYGGVYVGRSRPALARDERRLDIVRFEATDSDPLEVIHMLESVLATVRARLESKVDKQPTQGRVDDEDDEEE